MLSLFLEIGKFVVKEVSDWSERRDALKAATLEAEVAEIKARSEIAAFKAKADIEWDLAWAGQASSSWKDEYILILWTIPLLMFLPTLFFEGARDNFMTTITWLQTVNENIIQYYLMSWGLILGATFGYKGFAQMMVPNKVAKVVEAFGSIPDDIPEEVAKAAQSKVSDFVSKIGKSLRAP